MENGRGGEVGAGWKKIEFCALKSLLKLIKKSKNRDLDRWTDIVTHKVGPFLFSYALQIELPGPLYYLASRGHL